jgi:hypothetical protein
MCRKRRHRIGILKLLLVPGVMLIIGALMGPGETWGKPSPDMQSSWFINMNRFSQSAHGSLRCEDCHGNMQTDGRRHPDSKAPDFLKVESRKRYDYGRCKTCHKQSYARYLLGEHAKALNKEAEKKIAPDAQAKASQRRAPTCGDCHSAHYQTSHLSRVEAGKKMTAVCGTCHPEQQKSYLENYHGKAAVNLEYEKAAYCTDCHGAHTCISFKDNRKAALAMCRRCHTDAGEGFTTYVIHNNPKALEDKDAETRTYISRIHIISLMSIILVIFLLVCFYSHSFLLMLRKLHEKLRKPE